MPRQFYLAAYDISDLARQQRARQTVCAFAVDGQRSVYECWLTPAEANRLAATTGAQLDPATDSFLLLHLDPRGRIVSLGRAAPARRADCFYEG